MSFPDVVSMMCTVPSSAPTNSRFPAGERAALSGVAEFERESTEVVPVLVLNTMINGSRVGGGPAAVSPRMYAVEPFGERKNCVGVKLPCPRLNDVLVAVRVPVHRTIGEFRVTEIRSMLGGSSATSVLPSGRARIINGVFGKDKLAEESGALSQVR